MATLGNMMKRVKRDLHARNGLRLDDDDVIDAINDAISYYESERFHFNEANDVNGLAPTITTVIGTDGYAMPSTLMELDEVLYLDAGYTYPVARWSWRSHVDALGNSTTHRGPADQFTIHGNTIFFYPTPNAVTTVTLTGLVRLTPAPLSNLASENAWTTEGMALIRARASWDLSANVLANPDRAANFKAVENDALAALRNHTYARIAMGHADVPDWDCI